MIKTMSQLYGKKKYMYKMIQEELIIHINFQNMRVLISAGADPLLSDGRRTPLQVLAVKFFPAVCLPPTTTATTPHPPRPLAVRSVSAEAQPPPGATRHRSVSHGPWGGLRGNVSLLFEEDVDTGREGGLTTA